MNLYRRLKTRLGPFLLGVILALGATVAWAVAAGLVYALVAVYLDLMGKPESISDSLVFTIEGEPLLVTTERSAVPVVSKERLPNGNVRATTSDALYTYRTLDRQTIGIPAMQLYGGNSSLPGPAPPQWQRWGSQIHRFPALREDVTYWYAIYRADTEGHTYFVGYDPITRRRIGYLSTVGFHVAPPTDQEQFTVDAWLFSEQAALVAARGTFGKYYLVSAESLYAIAFFPPSVRPLPMPEPVVAVGTTEIPEVNEKGDGAAYQRKLVVRLPEELLVLNDDETRWRRVPIPPAARDRMLVLHGTLKPEMILEAYDEWSGPREIYWIDPEGTVVREATVALPRRSGRSGFDALFPAVMFPAPWMLAVAGIGPASRDPSSFALSFTAISLISLALAILCYRRHRAISRGDALAWAALVFVLGPPGLVGYLTHRRRPPKTRCQQCGAVVPRNRETCLACAAEFPPPAPLAIEIFA